MTNVNVVDINKANAARDLLMTMLNSTALEAFKDANIGWGSTFMRMKPLARGQAVHRFKIRGDSPEAPEHHVPGQFIQSGTRVNGFADVAVDDVLIKALRVDIGDANLSYWDEIEPNLKECVRLNAELMDKRFFRVLCLAARTAAVANLHRGGNVVQRIAATIAAAYPTSNTGAENFRADLATLARQMDEDGVPKMDRWAFITPYMNEVLTYSDKIMSRDYNPPENARLAERYVGTVEGFRLLHTVHLPSTNVTDDLSKYNGNFTIGAASQRQPICLAVYNGYEEGPVGAVQAAGMESTVYKDENRHCWMVKNALQVGLDKVSVWCAGEVGVASGA